MLAAWRDSPTRLREDAASEADLVRAGYRDRLLTELAQNAADAAAKAGVPGRLSVRLDGDALYIANAGVPLDLSGVHALTALRASGKSDASVGRFGVGFTAVLAVGDDIEFRSTTGSLHFSRTRTREALRDNGIREPEDPSFHPPALRLAWPSPTPPAPGYDSEIVIRLRESADPAALLAAFRSEAPDLLLELPALRTIRIGTSPDTAEFTSSITDLGGNLEELRILGPGADERVWWQFRAKRTRWLVPVRDGRPRPAAHDVLRAPTRSDEELSLPAVLVADIPTQPDRRRLLPGARVAELARGYADFARALPPRDRLVLVPAPGFARGEVDGLLREALVDELRTHAWLPVHGDGEAIPTRATVFPDLTEELAALLEDVVGPLLLPELSGRAHTEATAVLDVHRLGLARLAELSAGLERPPAWWRDFYAALEPYVNDQLSAEELGALAVPLADGRLVTGPRTTVLDDNLAEPIPLHWARLVHPEAAHPLLARLGARTETAEDLLSDPALQADLEDRPDDPDLADAVLRLAAYADPAALPSWLGLLELPDTEGDPRPADELLLPDAPLYALLVEDAPFGTVATEVVDRYGAPALRAVGVGWDFGVVSETDPTGPDHHLDDEETWWAGLPEDPPELVAVRDLDLVDEIAWPDALHQLLAEPRTRPLLADRDGYTAWWLRTHARVDGVPLGLHRHPRDPEFAGLLPEFAVPELTDADLDVLRGVLADANALTLDLAETLLESLADPAKTPAPEVVSRAHARLAAASHRLDPAELVLPERVRALSGATVDAADAMVLDLPWFGLVVPPDRLVFGDEATAADLATLLDLPLVSESVTAEVLGAGRRASWTDEPLGVVLRHVFSLPPQEGELVLHDDLRVRVRGAVTGAVRVPWWREGAVTHVLAPAGV
ncbi:ATP-binding protein [Nocardia puris]|uniref:sacsin N-terminal ATP-binding-like domain-containing protein n=1 Tax=Nocardia puris TaxID=208602 RepID=UPI001895FFD3|nr:ATP-binding protein [Nocardia puris]MBF6211726.1 ATP-binding protein [Nocardia puris]MBF6365730.1 ATP-binding protein [Nocardia puris]MBF6460628.1 ATP-binding protein [Nocardia puris]